MRQFGMLTLLAAVLTIGLTVAVQPTPASAWGPTPAACPSISCPGDLSEWTFEGYCNRPAGNGYTERCKTYEANNFEQTCVNNSECWFL